ncbi:MAG: hypothetical protein LM564_05270 [Desulfurococcaceae archaeon]|jgi:hypothetical protein|nr:hypothetical protein [Desulfurococcaceae archaeon]
MVVEQQWSKELEREFLLSRVLRDEELICIAAEAGLSKYRGLCEEARRKFIYLPEDLRRELIRVCTREISDEKLVEAFGTVKPSLYPEGIPFRGNYYTYFGDGNLQFRSSWGEVKRDVYEVLEQGGERIYAFLRAIVELTEELLKKHGPRYCYISGPDYGSILRRMREILGRFEALTPRDFAMLKAFGIYYKSGSRRYPGHSVPLEIIPAVKEALEEWRRTRERVPSIRAP